MLFYPVSNEFPETKVNAYRNVEEYLKGAKLTGQIGLGTGTFRHRLVSQLFPDAPLHFQFFNGKSKLIPAVFCHGFGVSSEDHFGVCM